MKIRIVLFLLVTWQIFLTIAVTNLIVATRLAKLNQSPFTEIHLETFAQAMEKIRSGEGHLQPDTIEKLLIGEHKVSETRAKLIGQTCAVFKNAGYSILTGVGLQLYLGFRLIRSGFTLRLATAKESLMSQS